MISEYEFVIVHGACGFPEENWFPWLKGRLTKLGAKVIVPAFPTPAGQTLDSWMRVFASQCPLLREKTVLIGHSTGGMFSLRVVEKASVQVAACYLVASLGTERLGIDRFDVINESFVVQPLDWERIRSNCRFFGIYHADNDPYIPLDSAHSLASKLRSEVQVIPGGGHFNTNAGFTEFPQLLTDIMKDLG